MARATVVLATVEPPERSAFVLSSADGLRVHALCRSGNPLLAQDLARVSVDMARAVVVLATAESPERSDARVLRIVLSLMGVHDRLKKAGIATGLKASARPPN